jgi:hypothetical protein
MAESISSVQIAIECKSLPRSGFHYLKNTLSNHLSDQFSYCGRYDELGCCKTSPCHLSDTFLEYAKKRNRSHIRLLKSHDFDLDDAVPKIDRSHQLLVLIRDPLFVITSMWMLKEYMRHHVKLTESHISAMRLLNFFEPSLLNRANELIDQHFMPLRADVFQSWLDWVCGYMHRFYHQWVINASNKEGHIVVYEDIPKYAESILSLCIPKQDIHITPFSPRGDAYSVGSLQVSAYLLSQRDVICEAIQKHQLDALFQSVKQSKA